MVTPPPRVRRDCQCPRARHQHGTKLMREKHDCPCYPCRVAAARARWLNRHGLRSGEAAPVLRVGTRRRIQALHALGWSGGQLAERLGVTYQDVHLMRGSRKYITAANAEKVAALYDELWDQIPDGMHVVKTRNWAARNGWVPPLCWDDDEIDLPDAKPHMPRDTGWAHKPCGTRAAYRRHLRRGEKPCSACVRAESERPRNDGKAA